MNTPGRPDASQDGLSRGELPTEISPALARTLTGLFLLAIFLLPALQLAVELCRGQPVSALALFRQAPTVEHCRAFEKGLEDQSVVRHAVQPLVQGAVSRYLGFGNSSVVIGRGGWLFYRPGVDFVTGPGLLGPARLRLRAKELGEGGEKAPCPDPRPAVLAFDAECRKAGAHLVVLPVPDKAMLQPAELTRRLGPAGAGEVPVNADYGRFLADLRAAGVDVIDLVPPALLPGEAPRFLRHDTHWAPEWMEAVAAGLAGHLESRLVSAGPRRTFAVGAREVRGVGDLVGMLKLPPGQSTFPAQAVTIHPVTDAASGAAWGPREEAEVLLMGDSFSNIYGAGEMGWGEAAGFPAQLARFLGRDVDVIVRNGGGATEVRRELARRPAPLAGKRVVVWEFAVRELATADWQLVPMPAAGGDRGRPSAPPPPAGPLVVEGEVVAASRVPRPYTVPYKDCLTYIKLRVDRAAAGAFPDGHVIAVLWAMKDNVLLPAAQYGPGRRLRLEVVPLRQAPVDLHSTRVADDLDDYTHPPFFVLRESCL